MMASSSGSFVTFGGSTSSVAPAVVERIQFSNNTVSPLPSLPVVNKEMQQQVTVTMVGGFGGAMLLVNYKTAYRIDYANDGVAVSPKGSLTRPRYETSTRFGMMEIHLALFSATDSGRPDVVPQGTDWILWWWTIWRSFSRFGVLEVL